MLPVDVVLLELHGAATAQSGPIDLRLLTDVRALVGPAATVAVTLDLHANLPPALIEVVDVVVGLLEYPHVDMAQRSALAARIAFARAAGELRTVQAFEKLPLLLPPATTAAPPGAEIKACAQRLEALPGVLACSIFHGFPYADTDAAGASVVLVGSADAETLRGYAREAAGWLWGERARFEVSHPSAAAAVAAARSAPRRPVVIGDTADNPGVGGPGDATFVARALLAGLGGLRGAVGTIHDPATVAQAVALGVGATGRFAIGGRHGWASGEPLEVEARVVALTDGRIVNTSMRRGSALDYGPSARLDAGPLSIVVTSRRAQVFDPEIFVLHGIDPARCDVIAVKSSNHFRSGFAHLDPTIIIADAGGVGSSRLDAFPPRRYGALWPLDPAARYP